MKSLTLVSTGSLCLAMFACSTAAQAPPSAMGGTSSGGSGATAGTGTVGTAGTGNSSSGGTMASAGTSSGGGVTSGGSSSGGSAGSETSGGSGGAPAGGMTSGGGASGSGTVDTTLVGAWDGALLEYACGSQGTTNYDCPQPSADNCKNATAADGASVIPPTNNVPSSWTMGGTPGTMYNVTMHVQGVVEVSWYHGGTRAAGNDTSVTVTPRNLFQVGGTALTFA